MDLAIESRFSSIQTMIVRSIHNQENKLGIAERCGLRQPNSKIEKNYTSMILYLFLYCSSFILTMLFSQRGTLYFWFIITCTLTLLLTLLIVRKNPGYVALPNKQLMVGVYINVRNSQRTIQQKLYAQNVASLGLPDQDIVKFVGNA